MRRLICILSIVFSSYSFGNTIDSLKIANLQREVSNLKSVVSGLQQEDERLRGLYQNQTGRVDSLKALQQRQAEDVKTLASQIGAGISDANLKIDSNASALSSSINTRTWVGMLGILMAIALLGLTYYILRRRINRGASTMDKIKSAQEGLEAAQKAMQEEAVKLDNKLIELLDMQVATQPTTTNNEEADHTLALKVADEIVRIETNLSRMDTSIKGYKQLAKAVERIRTNFLANGYEIVEMLGKPYNEGMKVVANFVSDDTLAEGEQKITGIIKPQINYKGKMIQSAQITVSQNL